jgi:glutamine---fructose-6-phosphate transaminase (isomerizing)
MCGIFAVVGDKKNEAAKTVLNGLKKLEYRGYDSWGIAVKGEQEIIIQKQVGKIGEAKTTLPQSSLGLGHTRWATHGGVSNKNAHPQLDCSKKIALVHNGIVENYQYLKEILIKNGHQFSSETDTEVIAHLIEDEAKDKSFKEAVFASFHKLKGLNAIAVLDWQRNQIIACRYGSPMAAGLGKNEQFLASDPASFLTKSKKVIFVEDGQGVVLSKAGVKVFNLKTGKKVKVKVQALDFKIEDINKAGFPHYLLKEIMEQKKTILTASLQNEKETKLLAEKIKSGCKPFLIGCGTAYYCCLLGQYFLAKAGIKAEAFGAYEAEPFLKNCCKKTLVIAVSQSGETADTLLAGKKALKKKAYLASVVNAQGSSLERLSQTALKVGAGPEIAVVSTKAFTSQLSSLYLLSKALKGEYEKGRSKLKLLSQALEKWLDKSLQDKVLKLAKKLINKDNIFIIGKHLNYPAGLEFALKIKETSYIHAEAFASGELKHGVLSLIEKDVPCIVLLSNDKYKKEVLSSAAEIKARGGLIIGMAPFKAEEFDLHIKTPDLGELNFYFNIIAGQLLGYYLGVGRGADPDKPRNLAKSVTVK